VFLPWRKCYFILVFTTSLLAEGLACHSEYTYRLSLLNLQITSIGSPTGTNQYTKREKCRLACSKTFTFSFPPNQNSFVRKKEWSLILNRPISFSGNAGQIAHTLMHPAFAHTLSAKSLDTIPPLLPATAGSVCINVALHCRHNPGINSLAYSQHLWLLRTPSGLR